MRVLTTIFFSLTVGCTFLFEEPTATECMISDECPDGEWCQSGRCRPGSMPTLDVSTADIQMSLDGGDGGVVTNPEMGTMPDFGAPAPFADGQCFGDQTGTLYEAEVSSNFIPAGDCSAWAQVWTEWVDGEERLAIRQSEAADSPLTHLTAIRGPHHLMGHLLFVPRRNQIENAVNIWRQDLQSGEGAFINPKGYAQAGVSRGDGYTAYVETPRDGLSRVQVQMDDDTLVDCGRDRARQWGVVAAADWIAWFEQRTGANRARIIVTQPGHCDQNSQRRQRLLVSVPLSNTPLVRAGEQLVWVETAFNGINVVRRWRHRSPLAEPEVLPNSGVISGNPVEIVAHADLVAVVSYRSTSPQFRLVLFGIDDDFVKSISTLGNVHRPMLTTHYLLWTRGSGNTGWEVKYESLTE